MAKQQGGGGGDWTAGIVAIVAAVLLGGAIPIALYYALYVPQVQARVAEDKKLNELKATEEILVGRETRVRVLETEGAEMRERLAKLEEKFTAPVDRADLINRISKIAADHNIRLRSEQSQMLRAKTVYDGAKELTFPQGLKAASILVDCQATYHDFGRFVAALESMPDAVLIIESLDIDGDQNGGYSHVFSMTIYSIERRNLDQVGVAK
ncbi:MAG: hypothetical protein KF754_04615 [Planctomycetes bacterium]|nr:hypothetical protein [Planctomycetota bacterium]